MGGVDLIAAQGPRGWSTVVISRLHCQGSIRMMAMREGAVICVCFFLLSPGFAQQEKGKPTSPPQGAVIDVGPGISQPQPIFTPDPDYPYVAS
jgi:hypothetical protein